MRAANAIALMLMLAGVASCAAQDYEILEGLGLDDNDIDGLEDVSGPDVEDYFASESPEVIQEYISAFAPYGIDVYAPEPAIEAEAAALSPDQALSLFETLFNIIAGPSAAPAAAPSAGPSAGRKLK